MCVILHVYLHIHTYLYEYISKVGGGSRGRLEGFLFNTNSTKV